MEFVFPSLHLFGFRLDMKGTGLGLCGGKKKWSKLEQAWPAYNFPFLGATKAFPLALQPQPNAPSVLPKHTHLVSTPFPPVFFSSGDYIWESLDSNIWQAWQSFPGKKDHHLILWLYYLKTLHYDTTVTNDVTFFFTIFFLVLLQIPPEDLGVKWAKIPWDTDILVIQERSLVSFTCSLLSS